MHKTVLLITPFWGGIGGVESSLQTLVKGLKREGVKVRVSTLGKVNTRLFAWLEGKPLLQALHLCPFLYFKSFLTLLFRRVEIVHAAGFASALIARCLWKPYIVSTHAIYKGIYKLGWVERWVLKGAKKVLCLSEESRKEMRKLGITNCDTYKTLIDPTVFKPMRVRRPTRFTVIFVSRPLKKKGWDVMQEVKRRLPCINFIFLSDMPNYKLPYYYNKAHLTVTAALYKECFSRTILESLFCGTPVLYSRNDVAIDELKGPYALPVTPEVDRLVEVIEGYKKVMNDLPSKKACRKYAMENYGRKNIQTFVKAYE